jgi:hypothetical protein
MPLLDPEDRRKLFQLIQLYNLEPTIAEIYVEGVTDRAVIEQFLEKNGIEDVQVKEIESIDFSELYTQNEKLRNNNKAKVIELGEQIKERVKGHRLITCIVDSDMDELLGISYSNPYLLTTDYTCLEMYTFNEACIDKFYRVVLHSFPITPAKSLTEMGGALEELYLIRYSINKLGTVEGEFDLLSFDAFKAVCPVSKRDGKITFDAVEYLNRLLNSRGKNSKKGMYTDVIRDARLKLKPDKRFQIHGHDFISLFHHYIETIKNQKRISEDALVGCLFLSLEYNNLRSYPLFATLSSRYKKRSTVIAS